MAAIKHQLTLLATPEKVYEMIATSKGLDLWWTLKSSGTFNLDANVTLGFGPGYVWEAIITKYEANKVIEYKLINAIEDWQNTIVGIELHEVNNKTILTFYHDRWKSENDHFQGSSYCWAIYLRLIKKYLETGQTVPYEKRLDV